MGTKPPAAVDECISMDGRHDSDAAVPHSTALPIIPARESGRSGLHAESGRVSGWAGFNPACRKAIPTHCLYCCCGALRAPASLGACLSVCPHGETWLPSVLLLAQYSMFQTSHQLLEFLKLAPYLTKFVHRRGLAKPEFFFLVDGAIALGDSLVQLTSSRVRLGQSFKTVGYGSASCWGDLGAGSVEADVFYIPFIVSVQYIGY